MNRAYSALVVKAIEEDKRVIRGVATTPNPDRVGDVIMPMGVKFKNPMPLLHQHNSREPVGTVRFDKATDAGIEFEARLPKIDEPASLKDRIDTAWAEIKSGLVRAVSVGFRPLNGAIETLKDGGLRFLETEVLELSLVTIPANADAKIVSFKQFDVGLPADEPQKAITTDKPAVSGRKLVGSVSLRPSGVPGIPNSKLRILVK